MNGFSIKEKFLIIILIGLLIAAMVGGLWYLIKPSSVRRFCQKYPEWDRFGKIQNGTDLYIRISGIVIILFSGFIAFGLLTVFRGI